MNLSEFDFDLPPERIAQHPVEHRADSRLMVLGRDGSRIEHRRFFELPQVLRPGDLLVLNDTRVLPARLAARKTSGGRVDVLLLQRLETGPCTQTWDALLRASRKPLPGTRLTLNLGATAEILERRGANWRIRLEVPADSNVDAWLEQAGRIPLPPYIERDPLEPAGDADRQRYQTVFARHPGAVAAPTAGLHFTEALLASLAEKGVDHTFVTLHVGAGTFLPIRGDTVEEHRMHAESFRVSDEAVAAVARTRRDAGRIVAVGTTVVRSLESCCGPGGELQAGEGRSELFIYPGFRFRAVDAMITNFHLPRSTLLVLVSAFAGRDRILRAYDAAIAEGYRFYSYGDAMYIEAAG